MISYNLLQYAKDCNNRKVLQNMKSMGHKIPFLQGLWILDQSFQKHIVCYLLALKAGFRSVGYVDPGLVLHMLKLVI